jgi:hypothetical protein
VVAEVVAFKTKVALVKLVDQVAELVILVELELEPLVRETTVEIKAQAQIKAVAVVELVVLEVVQGEAVLQAHPLTEVL